MIDIETSDYAKSQLDKFKQAALDAECDEDEAHWDEQLKKLLKAKVPTPEKLA